MILQNLWNLYRIKLQYTNKISSKKAYIDPKFNGLPLSALFIKFLSDFFELTTFSKSYQFKEIAYILRSSHLFESVTNSSAFLICYGHNYFQKSLNFAMNILFFWYDNYFKYKTFHPEALILAHTLNIKKINIFKKILVSSQQ